MGKLIILKAWMVPARAHRQNLPARICIAKGMTH